MPIKIKCPNCKKGLNANDTLAGKRVACPGCKHIITVPAAGSAAPPAAPPAAPAKPASAAKPAPPAKAAAPAKSATPEKPPAPVKAAAPAKPAPARSAPAKSPAVTAARPAKPPEPPPPPDEDLEHAAAAMLGDEPQEQAEISSIDFTCPHCDEPIKLDLSLAGKQTPCPECKRIVKVPIPTDPSKRNWRQKDNKPTAARRDDQPAPEGAWDVQKKIVSGEALEEAGALPDIPKRPWTAREWISRGLVAAAVLVFLVGGTLSALSWFGGWREKARLDKAMNAVRGDKPTLRGPDAAAVHLAAGLYHLKREGPGTVRPDQGDDGAWNQFGLARGKLSGQAGPEGEAMLIELALAQTGLIGADKDLEDRRRLPHAEVRAELLRTLNAVRVPEGRALPEARIEATRQLVRKLIAENQLKLAEEVAQQINDGPVSSAVAWSEFLRAGKTEQATRMANVTLTFYRPAPAKPEKNDKGDKGKKDATPAATPPLTPESVALAITMKKEMNLPEPKEPAEHNALAIGRALVAMLQGKGSEAREKAKSLLTPAVQIQALTALADLSTDDDEARAAANDAVGVVNGALGDQVISPWVLARLARVGASLGLDDTALTAVARRIRPEDQLRPWAQLQLFRAKLAKEGGKADRALADAVERTNGPRPSLSHGLALVELARHNAAKGEGDDVDQWDEPLRPYGYIGSVLGKQKSG